MTKSVTIECIEAKFCIISSTESWGQFCAETLNSCRETGNLSVGIFIAWKCHEDTATKFVIDEQL